MNNHHTPEHNERQFDIQHSTTEALRLAATGEIPHEELVPMTLEQYCADLLGLPLPTSEDIQKSIRHLLDDHFNRYSVSGYRIMPMLLVDVVEREQFRATLNGVPTVRTPYPYLRYFVLDGEGYVELAPEREVAIDRILPTELIKNAVLINWGSMEEERLENMDLKPVGIEQALEEAITKLLQLLTSNS